jgi:DNA (cytosine-5)-methyltransferase 1
MLRAIREIQPSFVVGENVRGLTNWNGGLVFDEVQSDLETEGYEVTPFLLPACGVNAPHLRQRIFFVAYSKSCADSRNSRGISNKTKEENGKWIESSTTSEQQIQLPTESSSLLRVIKNSNKDGWRGDQREKESSEWEQWDSCSRNNERIQTDNGKAWNASDSDGHGLRRQSNRFGKSRVIGKNSKGNNWENFPTVSPICDGNDGISDRLDGITFSKWRNESIKAGGNAVVPQVVYQIFKAIDQYNQLNKQLTL